MSKHIRDIEQAYKLLKKWSDVAARLHGDSIVALKEMSRLQVQTLRLIDDDFTNEN